MGGLLLQLRPGVRIGPYLLVRPLGRGQFGVVWEAERQGALATTRMALKLPTEIGMDLERIRSEAEVWARLGGHPNILPIIDADIYDGHVVLAAEYVPEGSLADWLEQNGGKAPSLQIAVDLLLGILTGLEHLHARAILHRDLKPSNILLSSGLPRLADFGLARLQTTHASGRAAGTPHYMAPDAFRGRFSVQTDLWSVGVIAFQLLTGQLPFPQRDMVALIDAIRHSPLPAVPNDVPQSLRGIVARALCRESMQGYRSSADMRASLREAVKEVEISRGFDSTRHTAKYLTVAITGTMRANPSRVQSQVKALAEPFIGKYTTWYCGTAGNVDEFCSEYLVGKNQPVIAVGYGATDISSRMLRIAQQHGIPFVDPTEEPVPDVPEAPSTRDIYFCTKADLVILLWDGRSVATGKFLNWLKAQKKDHLVGYV